MGVPLPALGDTSWYDWATEIHDQVDGFSETGLTGDTIDTEEPYRVIMFSDGTVLAIPVAAVAPDVVDDATVFIKIASVKIDWTAPSGAATYRVYRDGSYLASTSATEYRDGTVEVGETYTYNVQAVSAYLLRSGLSATLTAYIDPALNTTPVVEIRTWPAVPAVGTRAIVRVNALDVDGQLLALALDTDVGTLTETDDPSVWYLDPV